MTIFGMNYRPAPYEPVTGFARAWPLCKLEFRSLFKSVWGTVLFVFCVMPTVFKLFFMLMWIGAMGFGQGAMLRQASRNAGELNPEGAGFYSAHIFEAENGMFMLLLLTALATSRVIAKDRATNALEFYWTRGISPRTYFLAKWVGASMLVGSLTVVAPLIVWLSGIVLAEDWTFLENTISVVPRALLGVLVFTLILTLLCVLLSAIALTANIATILWCLLLVGGFGVAQVIGQLLRQDLSASLSIWGAASAVGQTIAGTADRGVLLTGPLACLAFAFALLATVAVRRMRVQGAVA